MAVDAAWYRSNADWMFTDWVDAMGYPYTGLLHYFLGHMKAFGNGRGKCKAITTERFAGMYKLPQDHVEHFIRKACEAGAMALHAGEWEFTAWTDYQSTDAERKRLQREREAGAVEPEVSENVTDKPGISVTNGTCPVSRATRHSQDTTEQGGEPPSPPARKRAEAVLNVPDVLDRADFATAWKRWLAYRRERRLTMTAMTLQDQLNQLAKEPDGIAVINQSIEKGWAGLFQVKDVRGSPRRGESTLEKAARLLEQTGLEKT